MCLDDFLDRAELKGFPAPPDIGGFDVDRNCCDPDVVQGDNHVTEADVVSDVLGEFRPAQRWVGLSHDGFREGLGDEVIDAGRVRAVHHDGYGKWAGAGGNPEQPLHLRRATVDEPGSELIGREDRWSIGSWSCGGRRWFRYRRFGLAGGVLDGFERSWRRCRRDGF